MKKILIGIGIIFLATSCIESEKNEAENSKEVVVKNESIENAYRLFIKEKGVKEKEAWAYQYKFGEPEEKGLIVYKTKYDQSGNIVDSIVYNSNRIAYHENYKYNSKNELIVRLLLDSAGKELQRSERIFNDKDLESGFVMYSGDSLYYKQERAYNEKDELIKLVEYDASGNAKLISEFTYNDNSDLTSKVEKNGNEAILSKITYTYDSEGNKKSIATYNSLGKLEGKTILKNYDNGNAQLIEKYDGSDSLYASYQYEYNPDGIETKSIIYNGIGQIIRQANTTLDDAGNKISFEIYEGEVGLLGRDEVKYNENKQETELIVYDENNQQIKRKLTIYNDKGLVFKEENYNKIDEPIYMFKYTYKYH